MYTPQYESASADGKTRFVENFIKFHLALPGGRLLNRKTSKDNNDGQEIITYKLLSPHEAKRHVKKYLSRTKSKKAKKALELATPTSLNNDTQSKKRKAGGGKPRLAQKKRAVIEFNDLGVSVSSTGLSGHPVRCVIANNVLGSPKITNVRGRTLESILNPSSGQRTSANPSTPSNVPTATEGSPTVNYNTVTNSPTRGNRQASTINSLTSSSQTTSRSANAPGSPIAMNAATGTISDLTSPIPKKRKGNSSTPTTSLARLCEMAAKGAVPSHSTAAVPPAASSLKRGTGTSYFRPTTADAWEFPLSFLLFSSSFPFLFLPKSPPFSNVGYGR